jgi:hypothetical protein
MRPPGDIRKAIDQAARELAIERDAATWRDMAERANVGYLTARRTVENMERAGALQRVGSEKREHSRRWMALYAPVPAPGLAPSASCAPALAIDAAVRGWVRR